MACRSGRWKSTSRTALNKLLYGAAAFEERSAGEVQLKVIKVRRSPGPFVFLLGRVLIGAFGEACLCYPHIPHHSPPLSIVAVLGSDLTNVDVYRINQPSFKVNKVWEWRGIGDHIPLIKMMTCDLMMYAHQPEACERGTLCELENVKILIVIYTLQPHLGLHWA